MLRNETAHIATYYDDNEKRIAFIRELGVTAMLDRFKAVLLELEEATISELTTPEYDPSTYNQQIAMIREGKRMLDHLYKLHTAYNVKLYAYSAGLSNAVLSEALNEMEQKVEALVITSKTMTHWKAVVVMLSSIDVFYVQRDALYEQPVSTTDQLSQHLKSVNISPDASPAKRCLGVTGDQLVASSRAAANKLREKITIYQPNNLLSFSAEKPARVVPIQALNTVDLQPELSKIKALESLLSGHGLSQEQNGRLAVVRNEVMSVMKGYLASSSRFWSPPNAALAQEVLDYFDNEFDPKLQVNYLLKFREKLLQVNSVNLLPRINDILVSAYNLTRITDARPEVTPPRSRHSLSSSNG